MKERVSYPVKIVDSYSNLQRTLDIFRRAVSRATDIVSNEWNDISLLDGFQQKNYVEKLIHTTKDNEAKYKFFDKKFYKSLIPLREG